MTTPKKKRAAGVVESKPSGKTSPPPPKRPEGRPSKYTEELAQEICDRIANDESLISICEDAHMPDRQTVFNWLKRHDSFSASYAKAREKQGHAIYDNMAPIEQGVLKGEIDPQAARVVLWSRQWRAARMNARNYSEKVINEITGKDGGAIKVEATVIDADSMTSEERKAMEQILLAAAARKESGA